MAQIKSWLTNEVLFEYDGTIKEAVEEAVRQGINLERAYLKYADLSGADLRYAILRGANLKDANLYNAYIRYADLNGAQLSNVNLRYADLYGANLKDAYLREAYLTGASLKYAILEGANLSNADLKGANLERAFLYNADLKGANLERAYLIKADLRDADLSGANLHSAFLRDAYLNGAYLKDVNLINANFKGAIGIPDDLMPLACPSEGSFIAWKKVYETDFDNGDKLVKLKIPADAKRSSATTKKCRCSKAKVLAITNLGETETYDEVINCNYAPLTYKVGEMVYPDSFDENRWNECSHGIHFFMDKKDAIKW